MLKLNNIKKKFNVNSIAKTTLYEDLSVEIEDGEFVTIIGSNGSGKSTLLNLVTGQVTPDSGEISFNEEDLLKVSDFKRFKKISRVYQDPMSGTAPSLTVLENLSLVSR
ncbi:ATP-binding cassette domain-containing protein [Erysipelothrix sp. D19-032]